MIRRSIVAALTALTALLGAAPASASPVAEPYCGITWGSGDKTVSEWSGGQLTNIRAGQHECYDRLVFDVRGAAPRGYFVSYVDEVYDDPTGRLVPLRGGAKLQVVVNVPAYDQDNQLTYTFTNRAELVNVTGFQTFRQVAWAGSFEGQTGVGLGVRARLPFRVFVVDNRVVVDVAHFW
jgi:hypothetical protein